MGWKLPKSLVITIPVVNSVNATSLSPNPKWMGLEGVLPTMLYGFHGSTSSKQPYLSAAYGAADVNGELSDQSKAFYLIDITYRCPDSYTETDSLYGQLPVRLLEETPFLVSRRLSQEAAYELGLIWQQCAKQKHGLRKVVGADVNWSQPMEYMLAFPNVVDLVFERLPNLQCILMPMKSNLLPDSTCLIGVSPKAKADLASAEVRFKHHIKVDLAFA